MRVDFVKAVHAALREDPASVFITGDLGYNALEAVAAEMGKRFVNAGVAEQNMVGAAAGMALAGHHPWVYSIAPFATYRCLEQIRNDVCLHDLPVRIVGNGGGYTYGIMGSTHHALEELAALKALPNMQLFFPCTNNHVASAVALIQKLKGPSYLRLSISGFASNAEPLSENPVTLTRQYLKGTRATLIGVGHAAQIGLSAASELTKMNVDFFGVARYPFDLKSDHALVESVKRTRKVLVCEEHYEAGSIAESLKFALPNTDVFKAMTAHYSKNQKYGSIKYLETQSGLTPEALITELKSIL
jgi:transketolase